MPAELISLLAPLQSLLEYFQGHRVQKNAQIDEALEFIYKALLASMQYSEKLKRSNNPDRNHEFELAGLWSAAAIKARYVSKDLALRLGLKCEYWSQDFRWSRDEILEKQIDFLSIQVEIEKLLGKA